MNQTTHQTTNQTTHQTTHQLTHQLIQSYTQHTTINHTNTHNLPSKPAIAQITQQLLKLLLPTLLHNQPTHHTTTQLIHTIQKNLQHQIHKTLQHTPPPQIPKKQHQQHATQTTQHLLQQLPTLHQILQTDTQAAYNGDPAALNPEEIILAYPFTQAIAVQRLSHILYQQHIPLIPRIMTEWAHTQTGIDLHPGAQIGTHFFIDHGTGTVIGETSQIGNHVKMYQGVALIGRSLSGGQTLRGTKRHPTIQDHVTLYANATIMGGDTTVGARSTIGANVFLTHSIPPDSLITTEKPNTKISSKLNHKKNQNQKPNPNQT